MTVDERRKIIARVIRRYIGRETGREMMRWTSPMLDQHARAIAECVEEELRKAGGTR